MGEAWYSSRTIRLSDGIPVSLSLWAAACFALVLGFGLDAGPATPEEPFKRMGDGRVWTKRNFNVPLEPSSCYADAAQNCEKYGRLYTWEAARRACASLGKSWRLPTDAEWRRLAQEYGGIGGQPGTDGKSAYRALLTGGRSGFDAVLGGGRDPDGRYARGEAHGFYWTATEDGAGSAVFYNFAHGALALFRQSEGEKTRAFSVRCIRK